MCIAVFLWQSHPLYPFLLFLNRDEYHNRATEALRCWEDGETVGGRDLVGGGTWLGCTKHGRLAFLTNFRETSSFPDAKSRGDLPIRFLHSRKSPADFAEEIQEEIALYNGFNLVVADIFSNSMIYITNRPSHGDKLVNQVSPGIHVLSNANLDSPWPKCLRLRDGFKQLLAENGSSEFPVKTMVEEVMTNTVKDEEPELPHVYPPEMEYQLSSIFVDIRRATVSPSFSIIITFYLFSFKTPSCPKGALYRDVMGPEASRRSASSPMVKSVSMRGILKKVTPGRNSPYTL